MSEYHKIQTVYLRDPATKHRTLLDGQWATPEFEYLRSADWVFTEKVDGTNIRVIVADGTVKFGGKTDKAQISVKLLDRLNEIFPPAALVEAFPDGAVLYGEGYGAGIQAAGAEYGPRQDFVLFDVRVGPWWLQRDSVVDIARRLDVPVVPVIGTGTLIDAIIKVRDGFASHWGNFPAEGIVARPRVELCTRARERIITKIKTKDFR